MAQPPGFVDPSKPNHVCLLSKVIYGLKQSPRAWFHALSTALLNQGFKPSRYDPSLFILSSQGSMIIVLIYVDDIIVTGDSRALISSFIAELQKSFALKDLGNLHFFLGIEVSHTAHGLHLTQTKYLKDILSRAKMQASTPCPSPMAPNTSLSRFDGDPFPDPHLYRSIVGALQYATLTRLDISYAVNKVSQFMHSPSTVHWGAVKRILRYLNGTLSHGLVLKPVSTFVLNAYSDADWAGSLDDRKSTSGFCVYLGPNILSWGSKKQATVSRSSTEAEFRSFAATCSELTWLQFLLAELQVPLTSPPTLWCDNIGANFLAANPMFHARTKHVEIDFHFIRERVANKSLQIRFITSKDQIADVFTKPLSAPRFLLLTTKLTVSSNPSACGGSNT